MSFLRSVAVENHPYPDHLRHRVRCFEFEPPGVASVRVDFSPDGRCRVHDVRVPVAGIVAPFGLVDHRAPGAPCVAQRAFAPAPECTFLRLERELVRKLHHDASLQDHLAGLEHPDPAWQCARAAGLGRLLLVVRIRLLRTPPGRAAYQRDEAVGIFGILRPHLDQLRLALAVTLVPVQGAHSCDLMRHAYWYPPLLRPTQRVLLHELFQLFAGFGCDPHAPPPLDGSITKRAPQPTALLVRLVDVSE